MAKINVKQTKIDFWFSEILTKLKWENKILTFPDLLKIFPNEIVDVEHIFLYLHKSKYISSHKENIELIQLNLQSGIPTSFNDLRFHIVHDEAYEFIRKNNIKKCPQLPSDSNQLNLNL